MLYRPPEKGRRTEGREAAGGLRASTTTTSSHLLRAGRSVAAEEVRLTSYRTFPSSL